jgi:hypothetical protein
VARHPLIPVESANNTSNTERHNRSTPRVVADQEAPWISVTVGSPRSNIGINSAQLRATIGSSDVILATVQELQPQGALEK